MSNTSATPIVPGDLTKGAAYIASHLAEYGATWEFAPVSGRLTKGGDLVLLRKDCPRIVVNPDQVPLFLATFGTAIIAKAINGTSIDVSCERIGRDALVADRSVTNQTLQERMVTSILLGVIVRGPVSTKTVYVVDGVEFTDKNAADAARVKSDSDRAAAFLAMCSDNGVDAETARALAKLQFPNAFTN